MSERSQASRDGRQLTAEQIADNFADLHTPLDGMQAMVEADRCLYCYDAPCIRACPTAIDIPTFIHQIGTGNVNGAARTILDANIMGGTCARVCPTEELCEQACVRNTAEDKPIEIGLLQRHAVDHLITDIDTGKTPYPFTRAEPSGKRVAIVGAGPAGLACAHRLAMLGHETTVFEAKAKPGGLNEYGLAAYKMVDDFAQREVAFLMEIGGITVEHGKALGRDITLEDLRGGFDAVFLGVGLTDTNRAGIDGDDLDGVEDAIHFIAALRQTTGDLTALAPGDSVVVIGGGNTAIDAAVQAKRLGAEDVTLVYRRGTDHMSATEWEQDLARTNGVNIRLWSRPVAFMGEGHVDGVVFERTELDADGRLTGTGRTYTLPADRVLKAIGQKLTAEDVRGVTVRRGKIEVDETYRTSLPCVYAGGDCIASGEDLTVQAVEDGKRAAHAIDACLKGATDRQETDSHIDSQTGAATGATKETTNV